MKRVFLTVALLVTIVLSRQQEPKEEIQTTSSFFELYEQNRYDKIPNYISLDFILTANYLFKQQSITKIEEQILYPKLKKLAVELRENILKEFSLNKNVKGALAYILVLNELLNSKSPQDIPKDVLELKDKELKLIREHKNIVISPIAKVRLDYSQYRVRGKYTKSDILKSYFLAMKYMSYMPFMVNPHQATGVTKKIAKEQIENAKIIAKALKPLIKKYSEIERILKKFSGDGDDLTLTILNKVPKDKDIQNYLNSLNRFPKISERIIDTTKIDKRDIPKASLALKFLPSRFTPDSYIFSQLTYPNVEELQGEANRLTSRIDGKLVRGYPTIMDLSAVLVDKFPKESNYKGYKEQIAKLKTIKLSQNSIYGYDFAIYHKLLKQNRVNSFKGYYTQSRYILNLYQKQSYTGGLKSIFIDGRDRAYLEDNIGEILELLIKEDRLLPNSKEFIAILDRLKVLDKKRNRFNREDISFLNNLDNRFKYLLDDKDSPIEVDIHTNPVDKKVMYEVLKNPIIKDIKGFRGAFYNHSEVIKER